MDYHQNARLTIHSRAQLARKVVLERCTLKLAAATNGKAERFIQTALREWAYAPSYQNALERELELHQ